MTEGDDGNDNNDTESGWTLRARYDDRILFLARASEQARYEIS